MNEIRAFPDRYLKAVAETGGVIGMAFLRDYDTALTVEQIAKSFRYAVRQIRADASHLRIAQAPVSIQRRGYS